MVDTELAHPTTNELLTVRGTPENKCEAQRGCVRSGAPSPGKSDVVETERVRPQLGAAGVLAPTRTTAPVTPTPVPPAFGSGGSYATSVHRIASPTCARLTMERFWRKTYAFRHFLTILYVLTVITVCLSTFYVTRMITVIPGLFPILPIGLASLLLCIGSAILAFCHDQWAHYGPGIYAHSSSSTAASSN